MSGLERFDEMGVLAQKRGWLKAAAELLRRHEMRVALGFVAPTPQDDGRALAAWLIADRKLTLRDILAARLEPQDVRALLKVAPDASDEDAAVVVPFRRNEP